jgi:polysaccharide export outer membrane protein
MINMVRTFVLAATAALMFGVNASAQPAQQPRATPHQPPVATQPGPGQPYQPQFDVPRPDGGGAPKEAKPQPTVPVGPAPPSYVIGPQDSIRITVFDEAELSGTYRVESDGMLMFPLVQRVAASGLTLREFQERLTRQLASGFIRNPQVRVEIDQYKSQSVFVMGEVRTPMKVTMTGTMTLLEALAQAGSPTTTASSVVTIIHPQKVNTSGQMPDADAEKDGEKSIVNLTDLQAANSFVLRDGDIITVPKAETFYIAGNIRNPGSYVLQAGETLEQALAVAGGLTERGTTRGIKANRLVSGKPIEITLKLADLVKPGDTITVPSRLF